jgi:hypothetical protein
MTLEGIIVGLFALAIGLGLAFYGFKIFLILLPIWGFFAGLVVGAGAISYIFGDGFLATTLSWVVGLGVGVVFAVLSYLYYFGAVALLGGVLGYQLAVSALTWIGFSAEGWIVFLLALIAGAIVAVGFLVAGMPAVIAIVGTAILGAGTAVTGLLVTLGIVPLATLNAGFWGAYQAHELSVVWLIAAIALAIVGIYYQTRAVRDMSERINQDMYRNPGIDRGSTGTAVA